MDKSILNLGFVVSSGVSAALAMYLMVNEYRKFKKQKAKAEKKKQKLQMLQQSSTKRDDTQATKTESEYHIVLKHG